MVGYNVAHEFTISIDYKCIYFQLCTSNYSCPVCYFESQSIGDASNVSIQLSLFPFESSPSFDRKCPSGKYKALIIMINTESAWSMYLPFYWFFVGNFPFLFTSRLFPFRRRSFASMENLVVSWEKHHFLMVKSTQINKFDNWQLIDVEKSFWVAPYSLLFVVPEQWNLNQRQNF